MILSDFTCGSKVCRGSHRPVRAVWQRGKADGRRPGQGLRGPGWEGAGDQAPGRRRLRRQAGRVPP